MQLLPSFKISFGWQVAWEQPRTTHCAGMWTAMMYSIMCKPCYKVLVHALEWHIVNWKCQKWAFNFSLWFWMLFWPFLHYELYTTFDWWGWLPKSKRNDYQEYETHQCLDTEIGEWCLQNKMVLPCHGHSIAYLGKWITSVCSTKQIKLLLAAVNTR